ncbi:MAG: choice-of-anchor D domain-containing protein [bacterium]|nr:choice-of-anchor D domain-containing protein [bacterium]
MKRFETILRAALMVTCIAVTTALATAQTLNVYNVNTSNFPKIKADYVAFDATGNPISGLTAADFRVSETPQGSTARDVTASITHACETIVGDPAASIVLVVDNSNSMSAEVNGKQRFKYVQEALKSFIGRVKFNGETSISIISFSGNSVLVADWQTTALPLTTAIDTMKIGTATRYEAAFESIPNLYDQFLSRKPTIPKYVFFLTDGTPNPLMDKPNEFVARNIQKCNAAGIRVFAITILETQAHYTIEQIAKGTGGKSIVTTEDKLVDLYGLLALETQVRSLCSIEWTSPYVCVEQHRNRTATITLLRGTNPTATIGFTTPPNSLASVTVSDPVLFVGDPNPNSSALAIVTITANGAPLRVDNFSLNPSTYFTVVDWNVDAPTPTFAPFTLGAGQSRRIRVQFTQGPTKTFRQASLSLVGSPCPPTIVLVAGTGLVTLQSPIGGELFSTCDTVTIKWAGVLPTQPVTLKYSDDDGATYPNIIANNATGLSYKWLPPQPGVRYRVQVSVSPAKQYQWGKGFGGPDNETASSIAVCQDGSKVYASGYFDGPAKFGNLPPVANAAGDTEGYFLELDSDGNVVRLVTLEGSASNDERIIGVITDNECNYYVAGYFSSPNANFGTFPLQLPNLTTRAMFIYKFNQSGSLIWNGNAWGDGARASSVDCTNLGIRYVSGQPVVVVVGTFTRYIRAGINASGIYEQSVGGVAPRPYFVTYNVAGFPSLAANSTQPGGYIYKNTTVNDTNGFTYETGQFSGAKSFGTPAQITIGSQGGTDVFAAKQGAPPSSSASSAASFSVKAPALSFTITKAVMNPIAQGQRINTSFTGILKNTGDFPVVLTKTSISGLFPADFILLTTVVGTRLNPGESISLEFEFAPTGTGIRSAQLRVEGSCGTSSTVELEGKGLPPCVWAVVSDTSIGKFALGQSGSRAIACVLRNDGPNLLRGTLSITGDVGEIQITSPEAPAPGMTFALAPNGGCLTLAINVVPTSGGTKSVKLGYGLLTECGVPETTISALVVEPRVAIDTVDLGPRRLLTQTDTALYVRNLNTDDAVITAMRTVDANDPNFPIVALPVLTTPITLRPSEVLRIPVTYVPQDRAAHAVRVFVTVQGQAAELEGLVMGSGFLAAIAATGFDFGPWTVNSPTPCPIIGTVTIDNTDATSTLVVQDIDFSTLGPDFVLTSPIPTYPITILPNDPPVSFNIQFTPKTVGLITRQVCITHEAKPGPGPLPPYANTCVDVIGMGISGSALVLPPFGNVLTCATKTQIVPITNPNPSLPLQCQPAVATGDVGVFTISEPGAFTIPPGQTYNMTVVFAPLAPGNFAASFTIANDQSLDLTIITSGSGITTPADFRFNTIPEGVIGNGVATPINVTVGNLDTVHISEVVLTISHPRDFLRFALFTQPEQTGWSFVADVSVAGQVTITGTAKTPVTTLVSGPFVTPVFDAFLTADAVLPVTLDAAIALPCVVASGDNSGIAMKLVCSSRSRLVRLGSSQFAMSVPMPNPATDRTVVSYSTGIEGSTTFEVVDQVGNVVKTIATESAPSAAYELDLQTDDLGTGIYYLRMQSGPFSATRTLHVIR